MEGKGFIDADRADLDPNVCPMNDFMALEEETRKSILPANTFGNFKVLKAIVDGGIF